MSQRSPRASARRAVARRTALAAAGALAAGLVALGACSAPPGLDDEADGPPDFGGNVQQTPGVQTPAVPGAPGTPASPAPTSPAPTASEQTPSNGVPLTPTPPSNGNSGNNGGNTGGSANSGAGGSSMVPAGDFGAGGSSMAPAGDFGAGGSSMGVGGASGETPPPVTQPPQQPPPQQQPPATPPPVEQPPAPPAAPDIPCPADATFCSGFEGGALPADASFQANPVVELTFDTTVRRSGNQSVLFPEGGTNFNIREIVVPIPGQSFWARLFIQTSTAFGDNDHDSLFVGSTARPDQDNNAEDGPEFSEQGGQVLLNANDQLFNANGPGFPQGDGPTLAPNVWHCVEAFYDGGSGDVQIFADGQLLLDAPGYSRVTYQTFRFGYLQFPGHTPRDVWYDDVVVAASRVGCN